MLMKPEPARQRNTKKEGRGKKERKNDTITIKAASKQMI
jgi:hypothetical protein